MKSKPTYQELEEQITEFKKQVEISQLNSSIQNEEIYHSLFENMSEGFARCHMIHENNQPIDFIYLEVNRAFEKLTGLKNVVGKPVSEIIANHKNENPELFKLYGRVSQTGISEKIETFVAPLEKWFSISVYSSKKGQFLVIFDDITERKEIEEVLNKTQETLMSALESMTDAIFISDINGNFIEFNEAFANFHRIKDKRECTKALKEWPKIIEVYNLNGSALPLDKWVVNRAINGEKSSNEEYIIERKDTGEKWYGSYNFSPIRDQEGRIIGSVTVARDITERKQAEEDLKSNKEKFKSFFDTNPSVTFVWKVIEGDFILSDVNEASQKITGRKASEFIGMRASTIYHDLPFMLEKLNECYTSKKTIEFEYYYKNRNQGTFDWIEFRLAFVKPDVILLYSDIITKRKQIEEEILHNTANLNALIENTNDFIWSVDKDYRLLTGNSAFLDDIEPLYNERLSFGSLLLNKEKLPFELYEEWKNKYDKALSGNKFKAELVTNIRPDNKRFLEVSYNPIINDKKEITGVSVFGRDVTEQKIAEQEIGETKQFYENIIEGVQDGIWVTNENDIIYFANAAMEKIAGIPREKIQGNNVLEDFPEETTGKLISFYNQAKKDKKPVWYDIKVKTPAGKDTWQNGWLIPKYEDETFKGIICTIRDVTEHKKAEEDLLTNQIRYKRAQAIGNVGNWEFDLMTTIFWGSDEARKIFGFKPEYKELSTDRVENCIPERVRVHQALIDLIEKDKKYDLVYDILTENKGIRKTVRSIAELEKDAQGNPLKITGVINDITVQKKADEALIKAKEKAEENKEKFKLLNRLTSEMLLLPDMESIYKFIAETLQKYYPNTLVVTVSIDEAIQKSKLEAVSGMENSIIKKIIKISGFNPFEKTFKLIDDHINYYKSGDFVEFKGGVAKFAGPEFPAIAAKTVEKLIGVYKIYSIGINKDDELLAAVHFLTYNKQVIAEGNFIEVFVKQAGLILQKKVNEKALKIAKEKAEESEMQLKLIADNFVNGMIYQVAMLDENRRQFNYISKNVEKLYGCTMQNAKEDANLIYGKIHPDDISGLIEKEKEALKNMSVFETEARTIMPDGNIRWAYYISKPRVINGIVCWDGIEIDITERKQMELELVAAKERAEESDRLKSAFLANMSHEIRTPMNGILGFTSLLLEPGLTGDEQQEYIEIIQKSGDRMLNTVNDIIDISKIEAGQMSVSLSVVNIGEQLGNTYSFFKPEADKKGIQFNLKNSLAEQVILIRTDEKKLNSILTNLVKNAIKYSDKGVIEFGVGLKNDNKSTMLEFYVKDSGIGIPRDRQQAIFERFIQADIEDRQARQGSGLGLTISKAYTEMLGGKIRVESEPGKGTVFYFTIPYKVKLQEKGYNKDVVPIHDNKDRVKNLNIVIAEDDPTSVMLLKIMLRPIANNIRVISAGEETVELCRNNPDIDLVLMDIQMPQMNGFEATRQIRQFNKKVVIIAQTAFALSGDKEKAMDAGCNDYISKPIGKGKLFQLIEKHLFT